MFPPLLRVLLVSLLAVPAPAAEPPKATPPPYEKREEHDPNGIGVFYLGREIAHVMGHSAFNVQWMERIDREEEEGTTALMDALKFRDGEVVADIGCGSGYISRNMAKRIGSGFVYAVDIQEEMLDSLAKRMSMFRITNVKPMLGTTTDPKLPPASCDTMIMVDVYHEFDQPYEMIRSMIAGLKPGGRIVFVEYRKEDPKVPIKELHRMSEAQVRKEMSVHPELEHLETIETLPIQHIIIFQKKK